MPKLYDIIAPEEEAFRKTFSKKRRGRPQAFPEKVVALLPPPEDRTWRSHMNYLYYVRALSVIFPEDLTHADCDWIDRNRTVLTELGRALQRGVASDGDARSLFQQVRDANMTTRAAVAAIRAWRIGHQPEGSVSGLAWQILRLLERYGQSHPETKTADVARALGLAADHLRRLAPDKPRPLEALPRIPISYPFGVPQSAHRQRDRQLHHTYESARLPLAFRGQAQGLHYWFTAG
jgi:hypothetical protein